MILFVPISGWPENEGAYSKVPGADNLINECKRVIDEDIGQCWGLYSSASMLSNSLLLDADRVIHSENSAYNQTSVAGRAVYQSKERFNSAHRSCSSLLAGSTSPEAPTAKIGKCEEVCAQNKMQALIDEALKKATEANPEDKPNVEEVGKKASENLTSRREFCNTDGQNILSKLKDTINTTGSLAENIKRTGEGFHAQSSSDVWVDPDTGKIHKIDPEKKGLFTTDNLKKVGIGAAAGAGAMYFLNSSKDKKEKDKKEKEEQANATQQATADQKEKDFQNGYAYNASGVRVNCQSAAEFSTPECKSVLLNFCGKDENSNNASCNAFASNYCSGADASQSFCLNQSVRLYCAQTGPYISANPSCQWISARPTNCSRQPESSACLLNWTAAKISEECPKYPYDPLCKAHKEGKKVLQLESAAAAVADLNATGGGLNSIINSTDQASASSSVNLFGAGSAAIADLCATGQLTNCN